MDEVDKGLYQEEQLANQEELLKAVKDSKIVFAPSLQFPEKSKTEVVNEIAARLVEPVGLTDESVDKVSEVLKGAVGVLVDAVVDAIKFNAPLDEVKVKNISDAKSDVVEVKNIGQLEDLIKSLTKTIIDTQPVINVQKQTIEWPRLASEAIPVRLSDGKSFYKALMSAVAGGGFADFRDPNTNKGVQVTLTSDGKIPVSSSASTPSTILSNKVSVTVAGTRVQLIVASTPISAVVIRALIANTNTIYVGDSTVASTNGHQLLPGESVGIAIDNLNKIWIDSATNGDGITYLGS